MTIRRLLPAALILLTACAAGPSATGSPVASESALPTPAATQTHTSDATAPPTPTPTPEPVDPQVAYEVFRDTVLAKGYSDLVHTKVADAMESDFYWVNSVDKTTYDPEANKFTIDISVDFEDVYRDDPSEWKADTWEFYTTYARDMWGQFVEGFASNPEIPAGVTLDWQAWTPGITLSANGGSLSVACPGSFIDRLRQREATQFDYVKDCTLKPRE